MKVRPLIGRRIRVGRRLHVNQPLGPGQEMGGMTADAYVCMRFGNAKTQLREGILRCQLRVVS